MKNLFILILILFSCSFAHAQVWSADVKILPTSEAALFKWQGRNAIRLLVNLHNDHDDSTIWFATVILPYQAKILDWQGCYTPTTDKTGVAGSIQCGGSFIDVNQKDEFSIVIEPQIGFNKFVVFLYGEAPDPDTTNNYRIFTYNFEK